MAAAIEVASDVERPLAPSIKCKLLVHHSRLSWDGGDNIGDNEDDIFLKDTLQSSISDSALLTRFDSDFNKLTSRSNSTSTPFCNRISDSESRRLKSESGFSELNVAQIFAHFCTLKTMENQCSTMSHDFLKLSRRDFKLNEDLLPLPKMKLLAEFDAESTDGDSALGDSIHSDMPSDISTSIRSRCDSCKSHNSFDLTETPDHGVVTSIQKTDIKGNETDDKVLQLVLHKFSPQNPENIIGRKMGLESVDILTELSYQSLPCVSTILSYLEDKDLCSFCQVSSSWKSICEMDRKSSKRKTAFLSSRRNHSGKENRTKKWVSTPKRSKAHKTFTTSQKGPLGAVQCSTHTTSSQNVKEPTRNLHSQFWEEAQKLKNDESLCKCPKCDSPSKVHKVQERAWCQNKDCELDFCTKCLNPFHGARLCGQTSTKRSRAKETVGSKKSKQRLKRL